MCFLRRLREWVALHGADNVVYFDESGFKSESHSPHGWAKRGVKVHGKVSGNNRKTINLIMAQRRKEWLAPMLFEKSCTHHTVLAWLKDGLMKALTQPSLIVMDNAPFHNITKMKEIIEQHGHTMLPLPRYSPDFNPIEQTFAIIKKRRAFSGKSVEMILSDY